jgi:hypothetical protein
MTRSPAHQALPTPAVYMVDGAQATHTPEHGLHPSFHSPAAVGVQVGDLLWMASFLTWKMCVALKLPPRTIQEIT